MNAGKSSIARRLILAVLALESLAALALIGAVTVHEERIQYKAFDANLREVANGLFGSVQEDMNDEVLLDKKGFNIPASAVYQVTDERGRVLGSQGKLSGVTLQPGTFQRVNLQGLSYLFFTLQGDRVIDPDSGGGIHHRITITCGQPENRVWHEVLEAIRFVVLCTFVLFGSTALLLVWLVRQMLLPVRQLADAAAMITPLSWSFEPPRSVQNFLELQPLAAAIKTSIQGLERAFAQQKRFTSDAAHELKTDLAILKSSVQLLQMRRRTVEEHERGLHLALEDLMRLERTVQKMLTLARLEQQKQGVQTCRMDDVIHRAIQQSRPLTDSKTITLITPRLPRVTVSLDLQDAFLLCSNVLVNALQHSSRDGIVEVACIFEGGSCCLTIREYGEGLYEDDPDRLFEPFYRSDQSRSRKTGGTGLGLSICRAICERVEGAISIKNHKEGGAVVSIVLPATMAE